MTCPILWQCAGHIIDLSKRTFIMGILNVTPDSFSDGGLYSTLDRAVERAIQLQNEGADIIDVGGESTRPGADPLSEEEELERVIPVIEKCQSYINVPISIDTYKAAVADKALARGAAIVNDISGCRFDAQMPNVVYQHKAGLVIMHIKGEPKNMQINPHYDDVLSEIATFFQERLEFVQLAGVKYEQVAIDPGIGFGKRLKDNFQILRELRIFEKFNRPILVGPSRKSFIGRLLDLPPDERIEGTIASATASVLNGAHIVRVHDVKEVKRAIIIADAISGKINVGE